MGYARKKEKVDKKVRRIKGLLACVVIAIICLLCVFMAFVDPTSWKYHLLLPDIAEKKAGELRVHFVDVGQGDATIIELPDGKVMLIDGGNGNEQANKALLRHLNALKIEIIDYLVVTHADKDHFGGLSCVLKYKQVRCAYLPIETEEDKNNLDYSRLLSKLSEEGCETKTANFSLSKDFFNDSSYTLAFVYPHITHVNGVEKLTDANEASINVWLDYQNVSFLFTGDATETVESKLMISQEHGLHDLYGINLKDTEFLKVSHHGAEGSTTLAFLEYLGVKHAVVSCGINNGYGHPNREVCNRLQAVNAQMYRTDQQGSVVVTADCNGEYRIETLGK